MSKIDVSDWKEFKVTNLLNWYHGRRRKRNDLDLVDFKIKPDLVGYLTAGFENQGAIGSCSPTMFSDETDAIFNRSITIDMFGNSFFHTYPCAGDDNVYFLTSNKYSDNQMLFLTGIINSITSSKFGYNDQFRQHDLETLTIKLPVTSAGEPDWDYMDEYIEKLATQAHKNVSSLATLKPVEHKIDIKAWKEFKVGELFDQIKTKKIPFKALDLPSKPDGINTLPLVAAGVDNQGRNRYVDPKYADALSNCLTVSANGANSGVTFYQNSNFSILQDAYALELNENYKDYRKAKIYLFLAGILNRALINNDWTNKATWARVQKKNILFPVTSTGQLNFDYMEKYIDSVQNKAHESLELLKQI